MMNGIKHIISILLITVPVWNTDLPAQELESIALNEKFAVITDRTLYAAGEEILFSAYEINLSHVSNIEMSKVLYVDIISPQGQIVSSSKFGLQDFSSRGTISIPDDLISGTYYLRFYTKWLRNYTSEKISLISIKIINGTKSEHVPEDTISGNNYDFITDNDLQNIDDISLDSDRNSFKIRDSVKLVLKNISKKNRMIRVSLSIVPKGAEQDQWRYIPDDFYGLPDNLSFIPETRSISLSGKVTNMQTEEFEPYSPVFLTLLDERRSFYPGISDSLGLFHFSLPSHNTGMKELFISAENKTGQSLEVRIDNDYMASQDPLPSPVIRFDGTNNLTALRIVQNHEVHSIFYPDKNSVSDLERDTIYFYGEPSRSLQIGKFIDLPSLEEYFLELLPVVRIIKNREGIQFRINGPQAEMKIYDPLVMIDGVVVHDNKAILNIDPQRIYKIDIIDRPWLIGDIIFGGIISITSKNDDFAGVDLPESGLFLTYRFLNVENPYPQEMVPIKENLPDTRNTLYWNPEIIVKPGTEVPVIFRTSDQRGEYALVLTEIDEDGKVRRMVWDFLVE